jgi:transcriptional regulator with XRE-family HTH domain
LPGSRSPTIRRRELGARLRALRTTRGWTVEQAADRLRFSPSKVSRLETGQRGVSPPDIQALCDLYEVSDEVREQLTELAAEGKQHAWWQSRGLPYSTYVGLESDAASIRDFGLAVIPGLLQTAEYARAVLRATLPEFEADVIEQLVSARMDRQRILTSERPPQYQAVIDEAVIRRMPADQGVMRAQLDRLVQAAVLPAVSIRIIPFSAGLLPSNNNKFIILRFHEPTLPTAVYIELLTGEMFVERPEEVAVYEATFAQMLAMAIDEDQTREMISTLAASAAGSGS